MTIDANSLTRFKELIPFYVNGTLDAEDSAFVKDVINKYPNLNKHVEFDHRIYQSVSTAPVDFNVLNSYASFKQKLPKVKPMPWWKKLEFNIVQPYAVQVMTFCFAIIVGQSLYIFSQDALNEEGKFRGWNAAQPKLMEYKLLIKPNARFADITNLLQITHCQIIAGPIASGQLVVGCESHSSTIQTMLSDSPLVNDVLPLK